MVVYKMKGFISKEMASQLFSGLISAGNSTHHMHQWGRKSMTMTVGTRMFIKYLFLECSMHRIKM